MSIVAAILVVFVLNSPPSLALIVLMCYVSFFVIAATVAVAFATVAVVAAFNAEALQLSLP